MICSNCHSDTHWVLFPSQDGMDFWCARCKHTQPEPADAWIPPEGAA